MGYRLPLSMIAACVAGISAAQGVAVGDVAPTFSLNDTSGRQVFSRDLQNQGGPFFLYFIDDRDDVSRRASTYINRMVRSYGAQRAKWYGVVNTRQDRARSYVAEMNPPYQILMDRGLTTVQSFGLQNSPAVVMIDRRGRVAKIWRGLSGPMLKDLNREIARSNNKRAQRFDFSRAPSVTQYGRPFIIRRQGGG